ncbi:MAG: hypothetical protein DRP64_10965 [Verrucomicrobia bacterium]|nr:MAG: hypothetical protein DRP64_10965 [Verrucomicrobiota bacterium]
MAHEKMEFRKSFLDQTGKPLPAAPSARFYHVGGDLKQQYNVIREMPDQSRGMTVRQLHSRIIDRMKDCVAIKVKSLSFSKTM